jgi:hypothetical protein
VGARALPVGPGLQFAAVEHDRRHLGGRRRHGRQRALAEGLDVLVAGTGPLGADAQGQAVEVALADLQAG